MKGCRPLTYSEITQVTDSLKNKRDKALFLLGIKSGFRVSELLSLRIKDIVRNGVIVDRITVARRFMKQQVQGRTVLLHPQAKVALADWLVELGGAPETYVFKSHKGANQPLDRRSAWRILNQQFVNCSISGNTGTHSMRKTFAARVYNKLDRDLVKTQRALGHKYINSTANYLSFDQDEIDQAIMEI